MNAPKETFSVGSRVTHRTNKKCNEGVVVWMHGDYAGIIPKMRGKIWSVHWSDGERGIYASEEIKKIPPKNLKKIVEEQITTEDIPTDEAKE
jgi:hypothetical protein